MMRVEQMTLEEKVGQLFTFYYKEVEYTEMAELLVSELKAGGLFLDMECLDNPEQVHRLTSNMQQLATTSGSGIPLFIAADLVAGAGCKLARGGAVYFPKNKAIGEANDERLAYESSRITAEESLAMGINFNYSPVVDINNNADNPVIGTHSFGETTDIVSRMGTAIIQGYQEYGMIATAKHFPGHGDTNVDSHLALPVLGFDRYRLENFELVPFRRAIDAGVDAIMVGHIAVPAMDGSLLPASLSRPMITELLREKMEYKGLIVTDGMSMKGVTAIFTQARACVMALLAGADILLADARDINEARVIFNAVINAVRSGELTEERINESVIRIIRAKNKYNLLTEQFKLNPFDESVLDQPSSKQVSRELAAKALRRHGSTARWTQIHKALEAGDRWKLICETSLDVFADKCVSSGFVSEVQSIASYEQLTAALLQDNEQQALLIGITYNKRMRSDVLEGLERFAASRNQPVMLCHFGSPYDAEWFKDMPALLLHDRAPALQEEAANYIHEEMTR